MGFRGNTGQHSAVRDGWLGAVVQQEHDGSRVFPAPAADSESSHACAAQGAQGSSVARKSSEARSEVLLYGGVASALLCLLLQSKVVHILVPA